MKKRILFAFLAVLALTPAVAQTGNVAIGPVASISMDGLSAPLGGGVGITGKLPGLAPIFGLNFSVSSEASFVGLTADWLLYKESLYAPFHLNFYLGPGFYVSALIADEGRVDAGLRIPAGINWTPTRYLEAFFEISPAFGISFQDPVRPAWMLQSAVGARFWF